MQKELHIPQLPKVGKVNGEIHQIKIPQCCREGWDDCPHKSKKQQKKRGNIGL